MESWAFFAASPRNQHDCSANMWCSPLSHITPRIPLLGPLPLYVGCNFTFYIINKESSLSVHNSSDTSSCGACSCSLIKNKNHVPILYDRQACNPTVLAAAVRKICAQNRARSHVFIYVSKRRYIFKKSKIEACSPWSHICSMPIFFSVAAQHCLYYMHYKGVNSLVLSTRTQRKHYFTCIAYIGWLKKNTPTFKKLPFQQISFCCIETL